MTAATIQGFSIADESDREQEAFTIRVLETTRSLLADRDLRPLGSAQSLADRLVAALPDAGAAWREVVGPVYTSQGLQKWLGITRQAISQHAQSRRFLRLITADGVSVFPSFQFDDEGQYLPHAKDVLDALAQGIDDPWTWATWLNTPDNEGQTYADRMRAGQWQLVCEHARDDAAAWSQP